MSLKVKLFSLLMFILFGLGVELALSSVFQKALQNRVRVPYSYISDIYKSTRSQDRSRLHYLAATILMQKESEGAYPQFGFLGNGEEPLVLPYWGDAKTRLFDFWGNRYYLGRFPVIVVAEEEGVIGDVDTYYYRIDTSASTNKAKAYLGSIKNLQMEAE